MKTLTELHRWTITLSLAVLISVTFSQRLTAQDQPDQDDPPTRVARLGYLQGSVSFEPAGENDWVDAVPNRPMTIGDQLWADNNSRAEVELGSAIIELNGNTGISFLNLNDHTIQVQLSSGAINIRVRRLGSDDDFEIDTPNQAFTIDRRAAIASKPAKMEPTWSSAFAKAKANPPVTDPPTPSMKASASPSAAPTA